MRYAILNVVPDLYDAKPGAGLFDLHEIESAAPDATGEGTWIHLKSGSTFEVKETPQQILDLINEG